jgi:hypothetical protein
VARARTYRAGREAELLVLGFPSGAWETAKTGNTPCGIRAERPEEPSHRPPNLRRFSTVVREFEDGVVTFERLVGFAHFEIADRVMYGKSLFR